MEAITFKKDASEGSFSKRLKQEVNEYFKGKDKKGTKNLYTKTIVILIALVAAYSGALITGNLLLFAITGGLIALVGFNIMHDASHGSYSNNKKLNAILAFVGADLMGGSSKFWDQKHNILHHSFTNIVGGDHDISKSPMFRFAPSHEKKWYHKYQAIYCWFLYMWMTIYWFYYDDFVVYRNKKVGEQSFKMTNNEKLTFGIGKGIHILLFLALPIFLWGWWALLGIFCMHAVAGVFLAIVFQMAHVVEGVQFFPRDGNELDEWYLHEVQTTADFASNSKLWTLLLGGLNYQIEHHLFRDVSHIHYPAISKIVQRVCREMNVKYVTFPTFGSAIASHVRHLWKLGHVA